MAYNGSRLCEVFQKNSEALSFFEKFRKTVDVRSEASTSTVQPWADVQNKRSEVLHIGLGIAEGGDF